MFVLSLSWQNDAFYIKIVFNKKKRLFVRSNIPGRGPGLKSLWIRSRDGALQILVVLLQPGYGPD
jgi:hypothetical protein